MKICFLGPRHTFSEKAALTLAAAQPPSAEPSPATSFEAVAQTVRESSDALGVLPYYNFLEGLIQESLDLIVEYDLRIADACRVPISFAVGGWPEKENLVFSHPKALAQCSDFLRKHFPDARLETVASTADAPTSVARRGGGCAVAGEGALENAGLPILVRDIANRRYGKPNFTEFLLLGRAGDALDSRPPDRPMRTMIVVTPDFDEPGLLANILMQVAFHRINVAKIHSRPLFLEMAGDTEPQMFYLELMCSLDSPALVLCVESLRFRFGRTESVRLLGEFPRLLP